jgi:hypothetical protein
MMPCNKFQCIRSSKCRTKQLIRKSTCKLAAFFECNCKEKECTCYLCQCVQKSEIVGERQLDWSRNNVAGGGRSKKFILFRQFQEVRTTVPGLSWATQRGFM